MFAIILFKKVIKAYKDKVTYKKQYLHFEMHI